MSTVDAVVVILLPYITGVVCVIATMSNAFVIYVIISQKLILEQSFYLITGVVVADLILGVGFVVSTIGQLLSYYAVITLLPSTINVLINLTYVFGTMLDQEVTLFIALDRILAVSKPLLYQSKSKTFLTIATIFIASTSTITAGCSYVNVDPSSNGSYTGISAGYSASFLSSYNAIDLSFCYLIVVTYLLLMFLLASAKRKRLRDPNGGRLTQAALKNAQKQNKLNQFLMAVVLSYIFTTCSGYSLKLMMTQLNTKALFSGSWAGVVIRVGNLLVALNTATNIVIYPWKSSELRNALRKAIGLDGTSSTAVTAVGKSTIPSIHVSK